MLKHNAPAKLCRLKLFNRSAKQTRNIGGLDVYKDCWAWQKDYVCSSASTASFCDYLRDDPSCTETGSTCVHTRTDGSCSAQEHEFRCVIAEATTSTAADCGTQTFCIAGECFDTSSPPDKDFAKVIAYKELVREATNLDLFKGEAGFCTVTPMANCCKAKGGGHKSRNDVVMRQIGKDLLGMAGAYIKTYGSSYVYSSMYASGAESMSAVGSLAGGVGVGAASESFSIVGFSFQYAAPVFEGGVMVSEGGFMFTGFDPYTLIIMIVIMIVMDMMECDKEEIMLGMKREQDLCHKVGSWCSEKILGSCWEKTEGWCCFPSKLGRIIQEQGREQLGKSWGDAEDPDCGPFTIAELEQLRFDEMDLSEFIEDIIPTGKTEEFLENAKNRATGAIQNYYEAGTPSGAP